MSRVEANTWVKFQYDITDRETGFVISKAEKPEVVFVSSDQENPIHQNMLGKEAGETFTVVLQNVFGLRWPHLLSYVDRKDLNSLSLSKPGEKIMGNVQGNPTMGVVRNIFTDAVVIDWNHPEAGKSHDCNITVLEVSGDQILI